MSHLIWIGQKVFGNRFLPYVDVEGLPLPPIQISLASWKGQIEDIRALELRDDDVILCAYPKAGTHWLWEVICMLLAGQAHYEPRAKELLMMDLTPIAKLHKLHEPRVLNTHLPFSMLPTRSMRARRVKVVHVYRNPRDVMVSMYYHLRQFNLVNTESLQCFSEAFLSGIVMYGHYAQYLNQMNSFIEDNPDHPVFNLSYEQMKQSPHSTLLKLAEFLGVRDISHVLVADIVEACAFNRLKQVDETKQQVKFLGMEIGQKLYRKGVVGDWKNHLSEDEADAFDAAFNNVLDTDRFPFIHSV